jgi:hypothetical protein
MSSEPEDFSGKDGEPPRTVPTGTGPTRAVEVADAIVWLRNQRPLSGCSLVASLPDISEFPQFSLDQWSDWFIETAGLMIDLTPPDGVTVFFQSDVRVDGAWIDKGFLCQTAAQRRKVPLVWHKICCRVPVDQPASGRAGYSHILCFSREVREPPQAAFPDVISATGDKTWERGMGVAPALLVAKFIATRTSTSTIVNPFCGEGSILAAANAVGLNGIGIERSVKRAATARLLQLDMREREWIRPQDRGK